jgi:hypothetical protein
MKRDWDLIRQILTAAETKEPGEELFAEEVDADSIAVINGHIAMLYDAGYVKAKILRGKEGIYLAHVQEITFSGYELLGTIRSDSVWSGIKKTAKAKKLELSFEVVKQVGKDVLEHVISGNPIPEFLLKPSYSRAETR